MSMSSKQQDKVLIGLDKVFERHHLVGTVVMVDFDDVSGLFQP